jgi:hypothetical protein
MSGMCGTDEEMGSEGAGCEGEGASCKVGE